MKSSKLLKILTLLSFIILMSSFVAYRTGAFEEFIQSDNDNAMQENQKRSLIKTTHIDSPIVNIVDTPRTKPTMMPTSKSIILIDDKFKIKPISQEIERGNSEQKIVLDSSTIKLKDEINIMGSSKSLIMFRPKFVIDTTKKKPKK